MVNSLVFVQYASAYTLFLFVAMLVCLELGRRIGRRRAERDPDGWQAGTGVIEGAMFGLLGLMLGFTFSAAMGRVDARRNHIVSEANAIGTAYLRIDLLPERDQPAIRDAFRRYTDTRLNAYALVNTDIRAALAEVERANGQQAEIWQATVRAGRESGSAPAMMLLLPAVNEMIDITAVRMMAGRTHNPPMFYGLIGFLLIVTSLLAGYATSRSGARNWLHIVGFAVITTAVVYVIIDVDYPRIGFFRMDTADQALYEVRAAMK
jgi:hypothetical protein